MRPAHLLVLAAIAALPALAQPRPVPLPDWKAWEPLLGEWKADPGGKGDPTGGFTLSRELGGRVLVRHNHAEYPRTEARAAFTHRDLLVVSREGEATRADYWDDEGHVIHYRATEADGALVLVSEAVDGQPRFRFTYRLTGPGALHIAFEIAPPGKPEGFQPYLEATAHRLK